VTRENPYLQSRRFSLVLQRSLTAIPDTSFFFSSNTTSGTPVLIVIQTKSRRISQGKKKTCCGKKNVVATRMPCRFFTKRQPFSFVCSSKRRLWLQPFSLHVFLGPYLYLNGAACILRTSIYYTARGTASIVEGINYWSLLYRTRPVAYQRSWKGIES
jgi:hypothetical protein